MNAQEILEKSFAVVRDLDTFVLNGNWVRDCQVVNNKAWNQTTTRAFQLSFRKPNEVVLVFHDTDCKYRFVGSSLFVKGPEDARAKFVGGENFSSSMSPFHTLDLPEELLAFIKYCVSPKEHCLWYVKRNSFRLVQVKEQANKLFLEGDLGASGIVRLTVSSISYFIHAIEVTTRPLNSEASRDIFNAIAKTGEVFHTIANFGKAEKTEFEPLKSSTIHLETELTFDRVALNPKLSDADFSL